MVMMMTEMVVIVIINGDDSNASDGDVNGDGDNGDDGGDSDGYGDDDDSHGDGDDGSNDDTDHSSLVLTFTQVALLEQRTSRQQEQRALVHCAQRTFRWRRLRVVQPHVGEFGTLRLVRLGRFQAGVFDPRRFHRITPNKLLFEFLAAAKNRNHVTVGAWQARGAAAGVAWRHDSVDVAAGVTDLAVTAVEVALRTGHGVPANCQSTKPSVRFVPYARNALQLAKPSLSAEITSIKHTNLLNLLRLLLSLPPIKGEAFPNRHAAMKSILKLLFGRAV